MTIQMLARAAPASPDAATCRACFSRPRTGPSERCGKCVFRRETRCGRLVLEVFELAAAGRSPPGRIVTNHRRCVHRGRIPRA